MAQIGDMFVKIGTKYDDAGMKKANASFANIKKNIGTIAKGAAILGAAFVGAVAKVTVEAAKFQQQLQTVNTMLDETTQHFLPLYEKGLLSLAKSYGDTTESLSKGLYDILSAGVDASKALDVLEASALAAKAGLTETGIAADAITTILNSYSLSADKAADISDWFFAIVKRGKTTFAELAPTIGRISSLAASAGLGMDELGAALSTMTKSGVRTDQAITSLRATLSAFLKITPQAEKAAKELGFEMSTNTLRTKGLVFILEKMKNATDKQTSSIFGSVEALAGLSAILKDTSVYYEDLEVITNRAGMSQEAFNKISSTLTFKFQQFQQSLNAVFVTIGTKLMPTIDNLIGEMNSLLENEKQISEITEFMNNLLTITVGTVKLLAKGFLFLKGTMETTITVLTGAFGLLTGNINLTKTALQELKKESKITTDSMILDAIAGGAVWKNEKEKEKIIQKQTNKDLLKAAKDKTDEETDLERRKFIKTLDLQRRTTNITRSEQLQRVNNTLEHLQKESETYQLFADAKIELETANTEARLALLQQLEDKFAVGITSMLDGSANFAEAVGNIWKSITNQILGYIGQIIAKWVLLNAFTGGGVSILGAAKKVLGFAEGGVVPGKLGQPQMVLAHGGEIIAPPQKLTSGITNKLGGGTVILNNPVFSSRRAYRELTDMINTNIKHNRKIV